jgi:hypothetical protein
MKLPGNLSTIFCRISKLDRKYKIAAFAAILLLLLFSASRMAFWVLIFIAVASVAEMYNAYFRTPLHLDFTKFGTILIAAAYGPGPGIFVGLTSTFFSKLFSLRLDPRILLSFAGIILIAFLASAFSTTNISVLGIVLVLVYYLAISPINILMGEEPMYAFAYIGTSLAFNAFLFLAFAPTVARLLF